MKGIVLGPRTRRTLRLTVVIVIVLAALVVGVRSSQPGRKYLTAEFASTISLYTGAKVKVLGVDVGKVDRIQVVGAHVQVEISYNADVRLPSDVQALIVPPSIVGDRFVQLAPAYRSGPVLADHATLNLDHTGVPLELDDTYRELDQLAVALGPKGANNSGSVSRLISAAATALSGNGQQFNDTIRQLAGAISTLADSSGDVDKTLTNLADLSGTLAGNDAQLRQLVTLVSQVGGDLNSQGTQISSAVTQLRTALGQVATFVRDNKSKLTSTTQDLSSVSQLLADRSATLDRLLKLAPVGLTSLMAIYQPQGWDPAHPGKTPLAAQVGSEALRGDFLEDLENQLGFAVGALCAHLPAGDAQQLSALCTGLQKAGGNLGSLLMTLTGGGAVLSLGSVPSPTSLAGLLGGTS